MAEVITWTPTGDGDEETAKLGDLALFAETDNFAMCELPVGWGVQAPRFNAVAYGRAKSLDAAKAHAEFAARLEAGEVRS